MFSRDYKKTVQDILALADIRIDGKKPWDIRVINPEFYARVLSGGSLALGESYMDGWWECDALDQFFCNVLKAELDKKVRSKRPMIWSMLRAKITNSQKISRAFQIGEHHYNIGNDLYRHMLDPRMVYSCGYWDNVTNLDQAQEAKLDLICKKIGLKPGQKVLDIGCGWGSFARYAAERYNTEVTGITVSQEQVTLANELCYGLPVHIRLEDYRSLDKEFDHIISVGMFEHVGYKNYRNFMETVHRCLKLNGRFLLHTIGSNISVTSTDPWILKYIFPNSMLPSAKQITAAAEGLFVLRDWHSLGSHYDKTLMSWYDNFVKNWDQIKDKYDEKFYRMWTYYLLICAGSFRANKNQLWQIVFTKIEENSDYKRIR
ncbi:MAG: cyclopropane fatty acyl phospholipid synthase [Candidatus Latescibacteria bacterium]|nr:cyclopropane fatty acyl phospholipid synthase [Candidatus Latescibacterota bacterium]